MPCVCQKKWANFRQPDIAMSRQALPSHGPLSHTNSAREVHGGETPAATAPLFERRLLPISSFSCSKVCPTEHLICCNGMVRCARELPGITGNENDPNLPRPCMCATYAQPGPHSRETNKSWFLFNMASAMPGMHNNW